MKYGKKMTALVLAVMMVLTMLPAMAFAEDGSADQADASSVEALTVVPVEPGVDLEADGSAEEALPDTEESAVLDENVTAGLVVDSEVLDEDVTDEDSADEASDGEWIGLEITDDYEAEPVSEEEALGEGEGEISLGIDPDEDIEGADPEDQAEAFLASSDSKPQDGMIIYESKSVKGDRLSGKDLKFYNAFKSIVNNVDKVVDANTTKTTVATSKSYKIKYFAGKTTFTAKQLGLTKIATVKNGQYQITSKAQTALSKVMMPKEWKKVYGSLISDLPNNSYWADWYRTQLISSKYKYKYNADKITITGGSVVIKLPVQPEFRGSTYKANVSKIKAVKTAKENAKYLVQKFDTDSTTGVFVDMTDEQLDYERMYNYCRWIGQLNTYDDYAADADYDSLSYKGPWSWVYVLDGNDSTNAVCEGYAKAFKYLCDLSTFKNNLIDCQIVKGDADGVKHMWNIVRMNDGLNYLVDPTWMDNDSSGTINMAWFLRGAPTGTASGYTIEGSVRKYETETIKAFAVAERTLVKKDYYFDLNDSTSVWPVSTSLTLKKTSISKLTKGSKSFKATWKKISSPLGALYIDGYKIQYSTKKSMKGAKTVTVKGYNHNSRTIKKLKKGKKYYVRVCTYAKLGSKTITSGWSKIKSVKVR